MFGCRLPTFQSSILLALLVAGMMGICAPRAEAAPQQMKITFGGYTNRSEVLTNFPVLVTLRRDINGSGFTFNDFVTTNGYDLRFTANATDTSSSLNYEIESWNTNSISAATNIAGCALWLRADAGVLTNGSGAVTNWLDQSGAGNNASTIGGSPLFANNGLGGSAAVVQFNGSDNYFQTPLTTPLSCTIVSVFKQTDNSAGKAGPVWQADPTTDGSGFFPRYVNTNQYVSLGSSPNQWMSKASTFSLNSSYIGTVVYDSAAPACRLYSNGALNDSTNKAPATAGLFTLGRRTTSDTQYFTGQMAEVVVYNRVLSAAELDSVHEYLARKYAIVGPGSLDSYVWVQVPTIPANGSGAIWANWGNTAASNQLACTTNGATWSNGFSSVWHFGRTNGVPDLRDSTSYRRDGANSNSVSSATGRVGMGVDMESSVSNYVDVTTGLGSTYIPASNSPITISCWFLPESIGAGDLANRIVNLHDSTGPSSVLALALGQSNKLQAYVDGFGTTGGSTLILTNTSTISAASTWYHGVITYDGNVSLLCQNGVEGIRTATGTKLNVGAAYPAKLGAVGPTTPVFYDGLLDEVRISSVARSTNWVWAEYQTMAANTTFNNYGTVASASSDLPAIANLAATNITATSAYLNGYLSSTGTSDTAVWVYWGPSDAGTNGGPTYWAYTNSFGTGLTNGTYTTNTSATISLSDGTTYYYNFFAQNASGGVWAATAGSQRFLTLGKPSVAVSAASGIGVGTATLNGTMVNTNGYPSTFFFCWGTNDYGTSSTNPWTVIACGSATNGQSFSTNLTGLIYGIRYWYYAYGTNTAGGAWSAPTNFLTAAPAGSAAATGGTVTNYTDAGGTNWTAHSFKTVGTTSMVFGATGTVEVLVVAGGGGSGNNGGGGGGAGGCIYSNSFIVVAGSNYTVTVGVGGAGGGPSANGSNSVFGTLAAVGGGGGGSRDSDTTGHMGGSGGGGGGSDNGGTKGTGTAGQGRDGGNGAPATGGNSAGGGGGGYASAGTVGASKQGGNGGNGYWSPISGVYTGYCGGGAGSGLDYSSYGGKAGTVQAGAGGGGPQNSSRDGRPNSGGGGGSLATGLNSNDSGGGNGGSGIVIVRYVTTGGGGGIGIANSNATSVTQNSATLNGVLTGSNTTWDVYAYWGPADGTNNPTAWQSNAFVGAYTLLGATTSTNISYTAAISAGTTYYCTFMASNAATHLWASPSTNFLAAGLAVTLDTPAAGAEFPFDASIAATATVYDASGPTTNVTFYTNFNGGTFGSAGTDGSSPYALDLGQLAPGSYGIYATVDAGSGSATSATHTINVLAAPTVTLTAPAVGNPSYDYGVAITATATCASGKSPYSVRFYTNNALEGTYAPAGSADTNAPYTVTLANPLFPGTYYIYAEVTDGYADTARTVTNSFTVNPPPPPVATLTWPTNNQSFWFGSTITATSSVSDGTPQHTVRFYTNDTVAAFAEAGSDNSAPYTVALSGLPVGNYSIYAKVTDAQNREATTVTNTFTIAAVPTEIFVVPPGTAGVTPEEPYAPWAKAATNIQTAVTFAVNGSIGTVTVSNGTYNITSQIQVNGPITLRSYGGGVYGGLTNAAITTIRYTGTARSSVVSITANAILEGFSIWDGKGVAGATLNGGGVYMNNGVVRDCIIRDNYGDNIKGGGVYMDGGGFVHGCTIRNNGYNDRNHGGGVYMTGGTVSNCTVSGNVVLHQGEGGGIRASGSSQILACRILENRGGKDGNDQGGYGGGIFIDASSTVVVRNCLIARNMSGNTTANNYGAGVYMNSGTLESCTIVSNIIRRADGAGLGGGVYRNGNGTVRNCVIYFNRDVGAGVVDNWYSSDADAEPNYTCTTPLPSAGANNKDGDPLFVNLAAGDYTLLTGSPCIDTGANQGWMVGAKDLAGATRRQWGGVASPKAAIVDMGAYEFPEPPPAGTLIMMR